MGVLGVSWRGGEADPLMHSLALVDQKKVEYDKANKEVRSEGDAGDGGGAMPGVVQDAQLGNDCLSKVGSNTNRTEMAAILLLASPC